MKTNRTLSREKAMAILYQIFLFVNDFTINFIAF